MSAKHVCVKRYMLQLSKFSVNDTRNVIYSPRFLFTAGWWLQWVRSDFRRISSVFVKMFTRITNLLLNNIIDRSLFVLVYQEFTTSMPMEMSALFNVCCAIFLAIAAS